MTIYKVDADDYSIRLSGAKFTLEAYDVTSKNWKNADITVNTGCQASKSTENGKIVYTTGADGYLKFDTDTGMLGIPDDTLLQTDTVYRLTETEAPIGYQISSEPYYFVFLRKKTENDFASAAPLKGINKNVYYYDDGKAVNMTVSNKFAGVSVRKVWEDKEGSIITDTSTKPEIKVQLYQNTSKRSGCKVTFSFKKETEGNPQSITENVYVKSGTDINLKIDISYDKTNGVLATELGNLGFTCVNTNQWVKKITSVTDDRQYNFSVTNSAIQYDWSITKISIDGNIDNGYVAESETSIKAIGSEVTLSSSNNWTYVWTGLSEKDNNGNPYFYTVKELNGSDGYDVSYTNNDGVEVGKSEIVITNKEREKSYILPETGGTGTNRFTAVGLALMAGSLMCGYVMRRKRRERREI